jgi:aspartate kinase
MHSRSIEFAKKYGVPIHVRSSFTDTPGTWILPGEESRRLGQSVTGAALAKDEARVTVRGVPDRPGLVHALFEPIARANIVVDMIVQNVARDGMAEVSFTVSAGDLAETLRVTEAAAKAIGAPEVSSDPGLAKVSAVGQGMEIHTGVARTMFDALAQAGVNIQMITTSEIKISVLVERDQAVKALRVVHEAFGLDQPIDEAVAPYAPRRTTEARQAAHSAPPAEREHHAPTRGMEDLVISSVELDDTQARITLLDVPDRPGMAEKVFRLVGEANLLVDMIVQNISTAGNTLISFTVPRDEADRAAEVLKDQGVGGVAVDRELAKLSVLGVGMRTHTGVATRMFGALAAQGINITMINTSEVRINVATDLERGRDGFRALEAAFNLDA